MAKPPIKWPAKQSMGKPPQQLHQKPDPSIKWPPKRGVATKPTSSPQQTQAEATQPITQYVKSLPAAPPPGQNAAALEPPKFHGAESKPKQDTHKSALSVLTEKSQIHLSHLQNDCSVKSKKSSMKEPSKIEPTQIDQQKTQCKTLVVPVQRSELTQIQKTTIAKTEINNNVAPKTTMKSLKTQFESQKPVIVPSSAPPAPPMEQSIVGTVAIKSEHPEMKESQIAKYSTKLKGIVNAGLETKDRLDPDDQKEDVPVEEQLRQAASRSIDRMEKTLKSKTEKSRSENIDPIPNPKSTKSAAGQKKTEKSKIVMLPVPEKVKTVESKSEKVEKSSKTSKSAKPDALPEKIAQKKAKQIEGSEKSIPENSKDPSEFETLKVGPIFTPNAKISLAKEQPPKKKKTCCEIL